MDLKKKIDQIRSAIEDELFTGLDYDAAAALVDQVIDAGFSELSPSQERWAEYLTTTLEGGTLIAPRRIPRAAAPLAPAPRAAIAPQRSAATGPYAAILRNIRGLSSTGRGTSVTRPCGSGQIRVALSGRRANRPGTLNVTNGEAFLSPDNVWFGRIGLDGEFYPARGMSSDVLARVRAALDTLNSEAIAVEVISAAETA